MAHNVTSITNVSTPVATRPQPLIAGFDYTKMDPSTADFLRGAATVIRSCQESWAREVMRIGTYLDGAKVRLPHGQFTDWLNAEFDMSERTAENYMSVARKFASKSELISDLPPSLLYKLAAPSTPETIVTKVIEDIKAGHPIDARGVMKEINAYRRSLSHSEGKPQHTSKAADLADDSDDQQEQQVESADRTQEQADAREVTTILSSLADTDLRRLNELLKKPSVWRSFRDLVSAARAGANALDIPPQLDRRVGPLLEEAMER